MDRQPSWIYLIFIHLLPHMALYNLRCHLELWDASIQQISALLQFVTPRNGCENRLIRPNRPMLFKGGALKWAITFKIIIQHKIDLRNGFLTSENLEIVVLHKVLRQIGAKPLQRLKPLAAILDLLHTGLQRALTSCLRSFSKSLWSWLTLCKISKTWPEVHDSYEFPPS